MWVYVTVYLAGLISGIILWEKTANGDSYSAYIKKIKSKGKGNVLDVLFKPFSGLSTPQTTKPISKGKQRRNERKTKRHESKDINPE